MLSRRRLYGGLERVPFVTKKAESGSLRDLRDKLDVETSRIVRSRQQWCITCGSRERLEASHFFSRRFLSIRFDLRNVAAQCHGCNQRHARDTAPYEAWMQRTYGLNVINELDSLRRSMVKVTPDELSELLAAYKRM